MTGPTQTNEARMIDAVSNNGQLFVPFRVIRGSLWRGKKQSTKYTKHTNNCHAFEVIFLCFISICLNQSVLSQITEQKFAYPKREFKHEGKFGTQYTAEEDSTLITLDPLTVVASESGSPLLEVAAVFQYPGKVPQKPKHISLAFYGDYADCKFSPQPKMMILADTERLEFGWNPKGFRDRKADEEGVAFSFNEGGGGAKCDEVMFMFISQSNFLRVVNAKNVEIEINKLKFKLTESNLEALRDLASRMLL